MGLGIILIAVGVIWLLGTLGVSLAPYLWPILLIAFGLWLILDHHRYGSGGWSRMWRMRW